MSEMTSDEAKKALEEAMDDTDVKRLVVSTNCQDKQVSLSISDTGKGIVKNKQIKIFGYGYTTKRDRVGLGLHICATAMTEMGGNIAVESAPRKGATFVLCWDIGAVVPHQKANGTSQRIASAKVGGM